MSLCFLYTLFSLFRFLSPIFSVKVDTSKAKEFYPPHSALHEVPSGKTEYIINGLEKFSLYEVSFKKKDRYINSVMPGVHDSHQ